MMRHVFLALAALFCLTSCAPPRSKVDEATIRRFLPGTWTDLEVKAGRGLYGEKTFFADGTAKGKIIPYTQAGGLKTYGAAIHFTSRWQLQGTVIVTTDIRSSVPGLFEPGLVLLDRVLDIDANHKHCHDISHRLVYTSKRWKGLDADGLDKQREVARAFHSGLEALQD